MTDDRDEQTPARGVTSVSLRAERLRRRMARVAGAKVGDPGLSPAVTPRDPALTNRFAVGALAAGIVAVFISAFYVASAVSLVLCLLSVRRWRALERQGKQPWGRRRTIWAFWFAAFGVAQCSFLLFVRPLLL